MLEDMTPGVERGRHIDCHDNIIWLGDYVKCHLPGVPADSTVRVVAQIVGLTPYFIELCVHPLCDVFVRSPGTCAMLHLGHT